MFSGLRMYGDINDATVYPYIRHHGYLERDETLLLALLTPPGSVFFDIGANIGWYTVALSRHVGPGGAIVAFEPDPRNFRLLKKNCAANRIRNALCLNLAVSDVDGMSGIFRPRDRNFGDFRIGGGENHDLSGEVRTVRLDEVIEACDLPDPDVIKIDTQGSEAKILASLPGLLSRKPDLVIFVEVWPHGMRSVGSDPEDFFDRVEAAGLRIRETLPGLKEITREEVLSRTSGTSFINVILSRRSAF